MENQETFNFNTLSYLQLQASQSPLTGLLPTPTMQTGGHFVFPAAPANVQYALRPPQFALPSQQFAYPQVQPYVNQYAPNMCHTLLDYHYTPATHQQLWMNPNQPPRQFDVPVINPNGINGPYNPNYVNLPNIWDFLSEFLNDEGINGTTAGQPENHGFVPIILKRRLTVKTERIEHSEAALVNAAGLLLSVRNAGDINMALIFPWTLDNDINDVNDDASSFSSEREMAPGSPSYNGSGSPSAYGMYPNNQAQAFQYDPSHQGIQFQAHAHVLINMGQDTPIPFNNVKTKIEYIIDLENLFLRGNQEEKCSMLKFWKDYDANGHDAGFVNEEPNLPKVKIGPTTYSSVVQQKLRTG